MKITLPVFNFLIQKEKHKTGIYMKFSICCFLLICRALTHYHLNLSMVGSWWCGLNVCRRLGEQSAGMWWGSFKMWWWWQLVGLNETGDPLSQHLLLSSATGMECEWHLHRQKCVNDELCTLLSYLILLQQKWNAFFWNLKKFLSWRFVDYISIS